jgi:hypothetical protein
MVNTFLMINDRVHRGWTPELYDLRFDNKKIFQKFDNFWKAYQIRNIDAGGQFYANYVNLSASFLKKKNLKTISSLSNIFSEFGEGIQILNDLGDFLTGLISINEKDKSDRFADLKNGVVTWPIWLMYKMDKKSVFGFYKRDKNDPKRIMKLFFKAAYPQIHAFLKHRRLKLQTRVRQLSDINLEARGLIEIMISMLSSNRILYYFETHRIQYD